MDSKRHKDRTCAYCGNTTGTMTYEHVVPRSKWRSLRLAKKQLDNPSNLVTACWKCNQEKGDLMPHVWFKLHPEYELQFMAGAKYLSDVVMSIVKYGYCR
jgi:5-methylcytosine-specific restriction endonuclease McrA